MTTHDDVLRPDEVRRQLRDTRAVQAEALPAWRAALQRVFDPESKASDATRSGMLGLPDRRGFLKIGGATVALSAVAAACSSVPEEQLPVSGTAPPDLEGASPYEPSDELDLTLLRTGQSIEVLAVETYAALLERGLLTTTVVAEAARLFMEQHTDHAGVLAATTEGLGGDAYDQANAYLFTEVVEPALAETNDEATAVSLALLLENTAAQTYVFSTEILTTPALRQTIMSIGGVEARHVSVLYGVQGQPQVPFAFMPRRARVVDKGFIRQ